jgi:hypothetical protein
MHGPDPNRNGRSEVRMSVVAWLLEELRQLTLAMLYFAVWIGVFMVLKALVLAEYSIEFSQWSMILVGALVLGKVVLVLEHVSLGSWIQNRPALVDVIARTALYSLGVLIVLLLEKGFEGRHEAGGFGPALAGIFQHAEMPHVWANTICLSGALLGYNFLAVVRRHLGEGGLTDMLLSPLPESPNIQPESDERSAP